MLSRALLFALAALAAASPHDGHAHDTTAVTSVPATTGYPEPIYSIPEGTRPFTRPLSTNTHNEPIYSIPGGEDPIATGPVSTAPTLLPTAEQPPYPIGNSTVGTGPTAPPSVPAGTGTSSDDDQTSSTATESGAASTTGPGGDSGAVKNGAGLGLGLAAFAAALLI